MRTEAKELKKKREAYEKVIKAKKEEDASQLDWPLASSSRAVDETQEDELDDVIEIMQEHVSKLAVGAVNAVRRRLFYCFAKKILQ